MEKKPPLSPAPQVFRIRFPRPLHITIFEPVTGYLRPCEKGWFVRSVNTMKIGCPSWPYLKICACCWTRSLLIPSWVDQFCYHQASVTTSVYVDGCASVKLLLYAMGAEMLSAVSNFCDGVSFTPEVQTRGQGLIRRRAPIWNWRVSSSPCRCVSADFGLTKGDKDRKPVFRPTQVA